MAAHSADLWPLDELTGLASLRAFNERLGVEFARRVRYGGPLALLMIDIDGLKAINETHGRGAGDAALVAVADIARATLRTTDVPARFGDDVFSVILPMTSKTEAFAVAEKLRLLLSEAAIRVRTADRADATVGIRVSIGVASVGEGMASAGDVIVAAERALDLAKSGGGDQVRLAAG